MLDVTDQLPLLREMIELLETERSSAPSSSPADADLMSVWRGLVNTRPAQPASVTYLALEDRFLTWWNSRSVKTLADCQQVTNQIYLYEGDVTQLAVSAIVNPANSELLGCFHANHHCLDNTIHTFAGVRLRLTCARLMAEQGRKEAVGQAKLTPAFHLPADYVIHTVGPFIPAGQAVSPIRTSLLKQSYLACLKLADREGLKSLAFPCISTGQFGFPRREAAQIALETVQNWLAETGSQMTIVFALYTDEDKQIYQELLTGE